MSFNSVDHSSPVTVTLSSADADAILTRLDASNSAKVRYDDSHLRATIARLQGEVGSLREQLKAVSTPKNVDNTWISDHANEFKDILKTVGINKETISELWGENFSKALSNAIPPQKETPPIVFPEALPHDPILRISAILSSSSLVTISILLMLQYIHNYN